MQKKLPIGIIKRSESRKLWRCKSYDEIFEYAKKVNFSNELFIDDEGDLTVYSQRLDYKYLGCTIYDRCESQQKPNGDISYTTEYVCEIWLMK